MAEPLMASWHSRYEGIEWRVTPAGIETRTDGLLRTAGEPSTMRLYLQFWGDTLEEASLIAGVPLAILMMTLATENGAAVVRGGRLVYPASREEPGYESDERTPHRISFGPCHILLSTARAVMKDPALDRRQLKDPVINILAAALYLADLRHQHAWDPILAAATYNAGGAFPARPGSRFHNRWHLRSWTGHLDRAARWYGDACAVLTERGYVPRLPTPPIPPSKEHPR